MGAEGPGVVWFVVLLDGPAAFRLTEEEDESWEGVSIGMSVSE